MNKKVGTDFTGGEEGTLHAGSVMVYAHKPRRHEENGMGWKTGWVCEMCGKEVWVHIKTPQQGGHYQMVCNGLVAVRESRLLDSTGRPRTRRPNTEYQQGQEKYTIVDGQYAVVKKSQGGVV